MRKHGVVAVASLLLLAPLLLSAAEPGARAATRVEIFYLPHPPAMAVVRDVEGILGRFQQLDVGEYSFSDPASKEQVEKYGLKEHMPIAIFINGENEFAVGEGTAVLRNFPRDNAFVPTLAGQWSYQDLEAILRAVTRAGE